MKKSELQQIIKEEINKVLKENELKNREDVIDTIMKEFPDQKNKRKGMETDTKFWTMNRLLNHYRELKNKK